VTLVPVYVHIIDGLRVADPPADELFLCGTRVQLAWIKSVDRRPVGSGAQGPISSMLAERFEAAVRGLAPEYAHWMTRVEV
jgi:branched-chain amino acid aminotransferase